MRHLPLLALAVALLAIVGCASMGSPDGGWYDERPPQVVGTSPAEYGTQVRQKKINIRFDEYIVVDNATENVVISPPQIESADIKTKGKSIVVALNDTLMDNTTYTIDFSSAIKDNNEGNYMGNYTFSFSTGDEIDTMQVAGYVVDAETLEPIEGILVGLYMVVDSVRADTARIRQFTTTPMLRVAKTDNTGHYSIKGVKPGEYYIYALKDVDNNFLLTPDGGEQTAFYHETIVPSVIDDTRQDTLWLDSLHIKSIEVVPYKHYLPDDITLQAFTRTNTNRYFVKFERSDAEKFAFFFTYGDSLLPTVRGINFDLRDNYLLEASEKNDTLTYWLTDTLLVNTDSLEVEMTYRTTDTLGALVYQTDTLTLLPKMLYAKRQKNKEKDYDDWLKKQRKKHKKGEEFDSIMPPPELTMTLSVKNTLNPDQNIAIEFPTPLATIDSTKINLYIKRDTLWYNARWLLRNRPKANIRSYELLAEWQPGCEYSFEIDSAAFVDIYGKVSQEVKVGFRVKALDEYGTLQVHFPSLTGQHVVAHLLDKGGRVEKEYKTTDGVARFWYLDEKDYYLRVIIDDNDNGTWDTGEFETLRQPEQVYFYPKEIPCRAKWDIVETWTPTAKPLRDQKPAILRKTTRSNSKQATSNRNQRRADDLGIELPDYLK